MQKCSQLTCLILGTSISPFGKFLLKTTKIPLISRTNSNISTTLEQLADHTSSNPSDHNRTCISNTSFIRYQSSYTIRVNERTHSKHTNTASRFDIRVSLHSRQTLNLT